MNYKAITQCRICRNHKLTPILDLGEQYLTGVFPRHKDPNLTRGPLQLVKCHGENACGLVQLRHSYESSEMYGANYGYRSGLNRLMVDHLRTKVAGLLEQINLNEDDIVLDIGANDGTLLSFYPKNLARAGIDPSAAKFKQFYVPGIQLVFDFFSADAFRSLFGQRKAKIVTSIAMFYDLEDPLAFVKQIAAILAPDGIWHFEQSYLPSMLHVNAYDTICHEHVEYYALRQIEWLVEKAGLKLLEVEVNDINGGSFAVTATHADSPLKSRSDSIPRLRGSEHEKGINELDVYAQFSRRVFEHRDALLQTLGQVLSEGKKLIGYGASTKGNVILQFCGLTGEHLSCIADVNPDKHGCVTPGTWIPIVSEAQGHAISPDYLLALPWHFRSNFLAREKAYLDRGGKMIFPLPHIEVVGR